MANMTAVNILFMLDEIGQYKAGNLRPLLSTDSFQIIQRSALNCVTPVNLI